MPGKTDQNQFEQEANEAQRLNAERLRKLKYNPDGSLKKKPATKKNGKIKRIPVIPYQGREMNKVVDES
tara:strand:+ start:3843 stop:4049 length:207 start_codon:yes stop_codon:yes gene_type:complete